MSATDQASWGLMLALLLQAPSLTGCGCSEGDPSHCSGNATEVCSPGDSCTGWVIGQICSAPDQYCAVLPSSGATCVASPDPVPECADGGGAEFCFQNNPSTCKDGYPYVFYEAGQNCAGPNPYCVGAGICTAVESTVPECADAASSLPNAMCWHNAPSGCHDGYVNAGMVCSGTCVETDASCAFCDDGTVAVDPTCGEPAYSTCFENSVYACACGVRTNQMTACTDAGENTICIQSGGLDATPPSAPAAYCWEP